MRFDGWAGSRWTSANQSTIEPVQARKWQRLRVLAGRESWPASGREGRRSSKETHHFLLRCRNARPKQKAYSRYGRTPRACACAGVWSTSRSVGVTTVRQTLGRGFERNRLFARPTNPCCAIRVILTATQPGNRVRVVFFFAPLPARDIALAPDGRTAAIVSYSETARKNVIWIYEVGSQGVRSLADTEGAD